MQIDLSIYLFNWLSSLYQLANTLNLEYYRIISKWLFIHDTYTSAPSRHMLVLFEQYGCPKKVSSIFLMHILLQLNKVICKYFSNKKNTNILPQSYQMLNIFGTSAPTIRGLYMSLNYPYTNVKKMACPKNNLDADYLKIVGHLDY